MPLRAFALWAIAFLASAAAAGYGAWRATEWWFRWKMLPYPHEPFAMLVAAGAALWALALVASALAIVSKRRTP